ncbi:leucine--tRNA ligase [Patescibacteria group bacterium]|nr:leucine--tRNA ligase [Patescibacteria group bacterium]
MEYQPKKIEAKWQKYWEQENLFRAEDFSKKPKKYILVEFPYPSGDGLHVGHCRSYTALDIVARKSRMEGFNVMYPMGWDAFGLPTENFAIKTGKHPREVTKKNTDNFRRQMKSLGLSFDWTREINTTDPEYYKWTQWIFLQLYKKGLAYKEKMPINWCKSCKIGLANEEVVDGKCERCGGEVERREMEQWMLKITAYADKLLKGLEKVDYPERVKEQQKNWIGKSEGASVKFMVDSFDLEVFTTRPDTLFGATYMVVAPEHELIEKLGKKIKNLDEVKKYIKKSQKKSDLERTDLAKEKTGVELKGIKVINPVNKKEIPVWVADYVLSGYGTGAIMAVPAHDTRDFEFAKKYKLEIKQVVKGPKGSEECFTGEGVAINSGAYNGLRTAEFKKKITLWLKEKKLGKSAVNYKLRDWVFSRQHYWGEPIPILYCEKCGEVPVPERDLPVKLPEVKKYEPTDTGESPLANIKNWVNTKCPKCGGKARRETDTMPNWAGSSWYFLRYTDPKNNKVFADKKLLKYWMPVDIYNGGMEHTTLHLLYSRFWNQFLFDEGSVPYGEPYAKRTSHGMVLGEGGIKMSKSRGNVINPDDVVKEHGADTLRLYEMFMGPFGDAIPWDTKGVIGVRRFLEKVWQLQEKILNSKFEILNKSKTQNSKIQKLLHKTIKGVTEDIDNFKFNTAISKMMILVNEMTKQKELLTTYYSLLTILLSPFAPHLAEELWEKFSLVSPPARGGVRGGGSIFKEKWPVYDKNLAKDEEIELVVQINGKVRDRILASADITEDHARELAFASEKISKYIGGKNVKKVIFTGKLVNIVV